MAYEAKDGKKFTNRPPMMAHNRSMERNQGVMDRQDPLEQPGGEVPGEQDGDQVAQEHGPAQEVHVTHDHEAGAHHVHSIHPDGHEHHSDHGSVDEAHEHAKKVAGGAEMASEDDSDPQFE